MAATSAANNDVVEMIQHAGDAWAKHWNAKQLDKVVEIYSEDAVYLPPHHAAVHGRDAIRDYLRGPLANGATNLKFEVTYIKQSGDLAYDVGRYSMTVPQADGSNKADRGKYLAVWRREKGTWKLVADSWSSDLPAKQ
jgi:uncharacterized protein (TIGR02246 family)